MTDEELLKIDICSRLPYGLKIRYSGSTYDCNIDPSKLNKGDVFDIWLALTKLAKPILFPTSCLTEEIRFRGEKIVPIEIIGKIYAPRGTFENGVFGWDEYVCDDYQDYYLHWNDPLGEFFLSRDEDPNNYFLGRSVLTTDMIDALNRLMIDYRGLIDKGLAVSVLDFKKNPYE